MFPPNYCVECRSLRGFSFLERSQFILNIKEGFKEDVGLRCTKIGGGPSGGSQVAPVNTRGGKSSKILNTNLPVTSEDTTSSLKKIC